MAETINRPAEPYKTRSKELYDHMTEHDHNVELVTDEENSEAA